jgi:uncharacterized membrane protein
MTMQHITRPAAHTGNAEERLARGIGWLSVGLGVAQLLAPRTVARVIGVRCDPLWLCVLGARELANGVGILTGQRPARWMWGRVAGDAMDLVLLDAARRTRGAHSGRIGVAAAAVLAVGVVDVHCSRELTRSTHALEGGRRIRKSIVVNRPVEELYAFWRNFEHLPCVMPHVKSVQMIDATRSHWVAAGSAHRAFEWDAEIIDEKLNGRIAWRSLPGSAVRHAGSVRFQPAPAGRGTLVIVHLHYDPPAGTLGGAVAALFGRDIQTDLRAFKQIMETGEIPTIHGQPAAARADAGNTTSSP